MTIHGFKKNCRELKQFLSTELNICYTNAKYSSLFPPVPVAEWLAYLPFDLSTRVRVALGVILFFKKISWLKGHWNVPSIQSLAEMRLKSTFPVTIQSPLSHHSVTNQSTETWDFILWSLQENKNVNMWYLFTVYDIVFLNDWYIFQPGYKNRE